MKALKNFLQTHSVSHFVCLTLAGHFHENLPKISATDIHYKINVCNKLVGISHSCRNCVITGDWDSGIEMTKDLPFTVPLAIFAVHPFQNALKITNHIQGWASIDASCYQLIYIAINHLWSAGKYKDGDASHYSLLHSRNHTILPHQLCVSSRIVGILRGQNSTKGHFGTFVQHCHLQDTQTHRPQKVSSFAKELQVYVMVYQEMTSGKLGLCMLPCTGCIYDPMAHTKVNYAIKNNQKVFYIYQERLLWIDGY